MSLSAPMRLDQKLVDQAKQKGRLYKRNARNQLEYWAELGRSVEKHLNPELIVGINEGLFEIKVNPINSHSVASESVFSELVLQQNSNQLSRKIAEGNAVYQVSSQAGLLEQCMPDGSSQVGRFIDGHFCPVDL